MGDIVNLKRFKKRHEREQAAKRPTPTARDLVGPNPNVPATNFAATAPASSSTSTASMAETPHEVAGR